MNSAAMRKKRDHKSCTDIIAFRAFREVARNQLLHCTLLIQFALFLCFTTFREVNIPYLYMGLSLKSTSKTVFDL